MRGHVLLGGKWVSWAYLLKLRREQKKAERQTQPVLFELKDDSRPIEERTASHRYREPSLFSFLD